MSTLNKIRKIIASKDTVYLSVIGFLLTLLVFTAATTGFFSQAMPNWGQMIFGGIVLFGGTGVLFLYGQHKDLN